MRRYNQGNLKNTPRQKEHIDICQHKRTMPLLLLMLSSAGISLSITLTGCKPKQAHAETPPLSTNTTAIPANIKSVAPREIKLSGQVFLVDGDQNIKLALVDIQLIPKKEVVAFLKQKLPAIGLELSKRHHDLENAKREQKTAKDEQDTQKLLAAMSQYIKATLKAGGFPQPELYFDDASFPKGTQSTLSDADGRFNLTYTNNEVFTLYAKATRNSGKSYWLVDAPTNGDVTQFLLSDHNIAHFDPDNYFKIATNSTPGMDEESGRPTLAPPYENE